MESISQDQPQFTRLKSTTSLHLILEKIDTFNNQIAFQTIDLRMSSVGSSHLLVIQNDCHV